MSSDGMSLLDIASQVDPQQAKVLRDAHHELESLRELTRVVRAYVSDDSLEAAQQIMDDALTRSFFVNRISTILERL